MIESPTLSNYETSFVGTAIKKCRRVIFDDRPKKWSDIVKENAAFRSCVRLTFLAALINCALVLTAKSEDLSRILAEKLLAGHWIGEGEDSKGPYFFHTINCTNGRFAVAVVREKQDTFIYFGHWRTDGTTITHDSEKNGLFEPMSLDVISIETDRFSNRYHIVELTEAVMVYEWRGESTRRFEAKRAGGSSGVSREKLSHIACDTQPSIS
ncbi:MAG: hypothetical protein WA822_18025 [Albidovulum sp.]